MWQSAFTMFCRPSAQATRRAWLRAQPYPTQPRRSRRDPFSEWWTSAVVAPAQRNRRPQCEPQHRPRSRHCGCWKLHARGGGGRTTRQCRDRGVGTYRGIRRKDLPVANQPVTPFVAIPSNQPKFRLKFAKNPQYRRFVHAVPHTVGALGNWNVMQSDLQEVRAHSMARAIGQPIPGVPP